MLGSQLVNWSASQAVEPGNVTHFISSCPSLCRYLINESKLVAVTGPQERPWVLRPLQALRSNKPAMPLEFFPLRLGQ